MTPEPGIYYDVPFTEYFAWDAVSNTILKELADKSPLHAKYLKDHPRIDTPSFLIGRAAHCLALEPDRFESRYSIAPECDKRTKAGKESWAAFCEQSNGRDVLTSEQYESIKEVTGAIHTQVIDRFIQQGKAEVCIVWIDKATGLLCKARLDYVHEERAFIVDLKTTTDANKDAFARDMWKYRYYQQAAFYAEGWKVTTGDESVFVFLPIEKNPPYAVGAYETGDYTMQAGRRAFREALDTYAECVATGRWPGYADSVELIDLPGWALKQAGVNDYDRTEV